MKELLIFSFIWLALLFQKGISQSLSGVKIYINPGHGGFDQDDRNVPVDPFAPGDTAGFWESKSNLDKALHLSDLLRSQGATVIMSRTQNRTVDDRPLSAIAEEANANQVDFMISIHSNAYNSATNYVLELYHGWDGMPIRLQSMDLANLFWETLFSNQVTHWTNQKKNVRGDKSFAPASWNGYGVLRPLAVPGLISEGSFHDYIPETYRLMNHNYRQMEAWNLFRAFCLYYGGNPGSQGKLAGFVKDGSRKVTDYSFAPDSKDQWLPVNGAKITLLPGNTQTITDGLNNGFFIFNNLEPGMYRLKFEADQYTQFETGPIRVDSAEIAYYLCYLDRGTGNHDLPNLTSFQGPKLQLFPNPSDGWISLQTISGDGIFPFSISSMQGETVLQGEVAMTDGKGRIHLASLPTGIYLITLNQLGARQRSLLCILKRGE